MYGNFSTIVQDLDCARTGIKIIPERHNVFGVHDLSVFLDVRQCYGLPGIQHFPGRGNMNGTIHTLLYNDHQKLCAVSG